MTATVARPRSPGRTPRLRGIEVARQTLLGGLSPDGLLVRGVPGSDIARFTFNRRTAFVLSHPDYVDHVLHEAVDCYQKSVEYEMLRAVLGLSLFTDEGESWRRHRMMLNPVMAKRHVRALFELMREPVEEFVGGLDGGPERIELEMSYAMTELTLDVVGSALFGRELGDFARKLAPDITAGLRAAELAARAFLLANPPWWVPRSGVWCLYHLPYVPWPLHSLQRIVRTMDATVWDVIEERQRGGPGGDDLLGLLLAASDEEGELPLKRVRDEALTFMLAGHETTANAMSWMWYLLALNHEARERMLAEVDSVLGGAPPTIEDIERLPWTSACSQEAMRLFPPAWIIPRVAVADDEIDGHRIRKGSTIIIPIHALHHDARFWPEPEAFRPERFLPEAAKRHHRSAYLPFGGGRRICIGQSFALIEMTLITAMMSQRFVYDLVPGHPVEPEATLTLRPRHGMRMVARRRGAGRATGAAA